MLADLTNLWKTGFLFAWLFGVILMSAFAVVRHADCLAIKLGEPYGTLILTLAVIGMEVMMVSAVMLAGNPRPTMARDTMFGVMMVVLNALVGAANVLNGPIHLLLFVGYFILMFEGRPSFGSAASGPLNQSRTERIPEAAAATISSIMLFTGTPSIR